MEKVKIVIVGEAVQDVGYRVFILNHALNFGIDRFNAYNAEENGLPAVFVLLEADEEIIDEFYEFINKVHLEKARVSEIRKEKFKGRVMNMEQYMHFAMVEQLDKGVPAILSIKNNTEKMLEKQDITIDVLNGVKEDTAQIPNIVENTSLIPAMKEDTSEIKSNTKEIVDKLQNKYEELSKEIAQIKVTLAKIETKVFA